MIIQKIKHHKTIVSNTFYLSIIQVVALLSPLVALPYVISTIGKDNYGLIVFAQSIAAFFFILINFGLDVSAVKDVSQNRDDKVKLSQIVSSVLSVKFVLFLISAFLYTILIILVPQFRDNYLLFMIVFITSISEVLFPIWYYQGIEKMAMLSVVKLISLAFYLSTLFFVVKQQSDYIFVPLLQVSGAVISALVGLFMLIRVERVKLIVPTRLIMMTTFKESVPFFLSRVSLVVNSNIAQIVSGIFLGMGDVAAFDIAKKIITFSLIPAQMLMQAIFPHNANKQNASLARKFMYVIISVAIIEAFIIYFIAPFAVHFFGGESLQQSIPIVRLLLAYLLFGVWSSYLGSPVLIAFGYSKPFNISVMLSTVALLVCYGVYYLFGMFTLTNFAVALILSEFVIAVYRYYYCRKYKII